MNYFNNVYFKADPNFPINEVHNLLSDLDKLGIVNNFCFNSTSGYYFVLLNHVQLVYDFNIVSNRTEISIEEFSKLVKDVLNKSSLSSNWFETLSEGDEVTIALRDFNENDYPYSFTDEMTKYCGHVLKIKAIVQDNIDYFKNTRCYNGDKKVYFLDEPEGYTWHSSMFKPIQKESIKMLELSNVNIRF